MSPMRCADQRCGDSTVHMHCPFCVKTDLYHDPVILKAHYRVKHVDKGIDFAGNHVNLNVLFLYTGNCKQWFYSHYFDGYEWQTLKLIQLLTEEEGSGSWNPHHPSSLRIDFKRY